MRLLFTLATFVGSLALFLIEPMVAKALLPSFGGSSLVWNVSLLFFQAALLGGYAYANYLSRRSKPKMSAEIHMGVLFGALVLTQFLLVPNRLWQIHPSPEASPLWQLLLTLSLTTAAPFIVLASGTPLIQRWFAHSNDPRAHDPYFLYAASNLGSFCGLIAYPALVEPHLTLIQQRSLVCLLFGFYGVLLVFAANRVRRFTDASPEQVAKAASTPVTNLDKAKWAALSAAPSALLLAVTTDLTKNIAPIPLLWVAPLGLYLLTFVIVFSGRTKRIEEAGGSPVWLRIGLALAAACGATLIIGNNFPIKIGISFSLISFFVTTLACHLQMARLRPSADQLTTYYLWVSIGGVLGGLFCAIVAPVFFNGLWELPIAYAATMLLYGIIQPRKKSFGPLDLVIPVAAVVALFFIRAYGNSHDFEALKSGEFVGVVFLATCAWPVRFSATYLGFIVFFGFVNKLNNARVLYVARNFYGYEAVTEERDGAYHRLINGSILHGAQYIDPVRSHTPTTYYSKEGPLGMALLPTIKAHPNARIGAVGLGTGTEAAYGQPGMTIDFYELNPEIKKIATTPSLFTYVTSSPAKVNIILGDARLSLVDAEQHQYDVIILDAFSSDSIPVHLLTKEAFQLYREKLKPDGIILVHTSNRYLLLSQVVAATSASDGFACDLAEDSPDKDLLDHMQTTWLCVAPDRARLSQIEGKESLWEPFTSKMTQPWTDDYSNVFGALKVLHSN